MRLEVLPEYVWIVCGQQIWRRGSGTGCLLMRGHSSCIGIVCEQASSPSNLIKTISNFDVNMRKSVFCLL